MYSRRHKYEMSRLKRSASTDSAILAPKLSKGKIFVKSESPTSNSSLSPTGDEIMNTKLYQQKHNTMKQNAVSPQSVTSANARERAVTSSGSRNRSPTSTTGSQPVPNLSKMAGGSTHRQLSKLKRFLATLQQFGGQIAPEVGERVQVLVFSLVSGSITIESFHDRLQEATNFPLRPFVIPFLKSTLPLLQNELFRNARKNKMTPYEYLRFDDRFLASTQRIVQQDSFDNPMDINVNGKRANGDGRNLDLEKKKPRIQNPIPINRMSPNPSQSNDPIHARLHNESRGLMSPSQRPNTTSRHNNGFSQPHRLSPSHFARFPPRLNPVDDQLIAPISRTSSASPHRGMRRMNIPPQHRLFADGRQPPVMPMRDRRLSDREWIEDAKQIDYLLTYIVDVVEKARQCLHTMHRNFDTLYDESARWRRLYEEGDQLKRREFISETEKRMSQVRKQAESEVIDVKRRLVAELERAATDPREVHLARRQMEPEVASRKQEDTHENCWNCGRRAQETCSGCNLARYCGSFCQHKDWENHHKVCGPDIKTRLESSNAKHSSMKTQSPTDHKTPSSTPQSPAPSGATENKGDSGK